MTNPDNHYYNLPSRLISPLVEHNTNNPHSSSVTIESIESGTSLRNEGHELRYKFRNRNRNNLDKIYDE
jgi:hypothetical protein